MQKLDTVILPVAGLGTRMLPATKAVPKELLPVYDTPLLQFALDEAVAAGARRIVLVNHPSKTALEAYFAPTDELQAKLSRTGKADLAAELERSRVPAGVEVVFAYQQEQLGLGHAVLCGAEKALPGPFGVILADDVILERCCLGEMVEAFDPSRMKSLVGAMEVPLNRVSRYGIFRPDGEKGETIPASGLVEKPAPAEAPSTLAAVGRYVLSEEIFDVLKSQTPGAGGEIQLTDAIARMGRLHAFPLRQQRFDCGSKEGLFEAGQAMRLSMLGLQGAGVAAE